MNIPSWFTKSYVAVTSQICVNTEPDKFIDTCFECKILTGLTSLASQLSRQCSSLCNLPEVWKLGTLQLLSTESGSGEGDGSWDSLSHSLPDFLLISQQSGSQEGVGRRRRGAELGREESGQARWGSVLQDRVRSRCLQDRVGTWWSGPDGRAGSRSGVVRAMSDQGQGK